ncbi:uncharacterized protein LOC114357775 [Ostrinia furnacalis]|uniref:uncharacterized protein LOC114357775 n=1 Tax=Ostrinia furnacalis TaxID=93504 RepID=UPI001038D6DB|nr:uncharacterized protein LOC114357775 [Ostrinia furnacalis]XP_028167355.1 uncharacterized protein LOC114357775 [Ostrinia furnacalis]
MEHQNMEIKSTKKRVRSSNWDEDEKKLLRQLIMEKIDVVEKKDCTTNTHAEKKAAWQEILSSFNSLNKKKRDMTQIITQWRNTKGQVKSRESEYRRARLMTGGGPPPPSPSQEDMEIIQILPNEFVVDSNAFDSDSIFIKKMEQSQSPATQKVQLPSKSEVTEVLVSTSDSEIIIDSEKSIQISNPLEDAEEKVLQLTPIASTSNSILKKKNIMRRKLYKPKKKEIKIADDYEEELFLLTKKSKEHREKREEELHTKRMIILDFEQKYWEIKFKNELDKTVFK